MISREYIGEGDLVQLSPYVGDVTAGKQLFYGIVIDIERGFYKRTGSPSSDRVHVLWNNGSVSAEPDVCVLVFQQQECA